VVHFEKKTLIILLVSLIFVNNYFCIPLIGVNKTLASFDGSEVVKIAKKYIGVPYLSGGDNPTEGFNSSGFVQYVFLEAAKIQLPRTAKEQYTWGTSIGI